MGRILKRFFKFDKVMGVIILLTAAGLVYGLWPWGPTVQARGFLSLQLTDSASMDAIPVGEIVEARTETSKTAYLGSGRYSLDASIGAVHYKDSQGDWENIDNTITNGIMDRAGYNFRLLQSGFDAGQIVEFSVGSSYIRLQPMALEYSNDLKQIQQISMPQAVMGVVTNTPVQLLSGMDSQQGKVTWVGAYGPNRDFEWMTQPTRLMKLLTIQDYNDLPLPPEYIIDGGNPYLRLNMIFAPSSDMNIYVDGTLWDKSSMVQTFGRVEFCKDGKTLWDFAPLLYWDSGDSYGESVKTLRGAGQSLYIEIRVPYSWLQTSIYPVFIDATIELFPTNYRYFHADAWNGDLKWLVDEPDGASPASSPSSNLNKTGSKLVQGFASESVNETSLSAGHWGFYLWGNHSGTTLEVSFFVEVRKNDVTGTLLATSGYTPNLTTTETEYYTYLDFPQTAWTPGDKVWVGIYTYVTTAQVGRYAYFYYDHSSRLSRVVDPAVDVVVGNGADDGMIWTPGTNFDSVSAYHTAGQSATSEYSLFARWTGVTISGTILSSNMSVRGYSVTGTPALKVRGVDEDNPAAPTSQAEFLADALTDASVDWDGAWTVSQWNDSPSLNTIFQELVDSYTVDNDTVMVQIWDDQASANQFNRAHTYESNSAYGAKLHIEYEVGGGEADISNAPAYVNLGVVYTNSTYWSHNATLGYEPTWPLTDGQCTFNLTNVGAGLIDVSINSTDFTGGAGWVLDTVQGTDQVVMRAGRSNIANMGQMVTLNGTQQSFLVSMASGNSTYWEVSLNSSLVHTDGMGKAALITIVGSTS